MVDRRDLLGLEVTKRGLLDHYPLCWWFRENQGRITALGKGQFLQHDHFASSTPLALLVITIMISNLLFAEPVVTFEVWLLVGEVAVTLTLSWASQPSIIRFVLFSFFNNWIWKSSGNKPVVGSDLKWLKLSLMLSWAHSSPWSVAELCLKPNVPLRKDQGFPVVFQILAAIYVGTST